MRFQFQEFNKDFKYNIKIVVLICYFWHCPANNIHINVGTF